MISTHDAHAYKSGITRTYVARCRTCSWIVTTGTFKSAARKAAEHEAVALLYTQEETR